MYIVAWSVFTSSEGEIRCWQLVDGEDAMQIRVSELIEEDGLSEDEIVVGSVIK